MFDQPCFFLGSSPIQPGISYSLKLTESFEKKSNDPVNFSHTMVILSFPPESSAARINAPEFSSIEVGI